jgi:hypothetical protein
MSGVKSKRMQRKDGTLLNDDRKVTPEDPAALTRMRRAEILVALATGRSNHSPAMLMERLGYCGSMGSMPVDYIIFSTGAGVIDYPGGQILRSVSLAQKDVLSISQGDLASRRQVAVNRDFCSVGLKEIWKVSKAKKLPVKCGIIETCYSR